MPKNKVLIPLQYFGLGDIIYQQSLVNYFILQDYKVLWPVEATYVEDLNRAYPAMTFIDKNLLNIDYGSKKDIEVSGIRFIPLRWADVILKLPAKDCMKAKYLLYNLDWRSWKEHGYWQRDYDRENALYDKLGLNSAEPYNLINNTYQSSFLGKSRFNVESNLRGIEMSAIQGYSIFDWAKVIENAYEIHTVVTSLFYLLELLPLTQPIHLYPRANDPNHEHVRYLFTKPYILHY